MSVREAIKSLGAIAPNLVVLPDREEYSVILHSYLSALEGDLKPAAFAVPSSKEQVAEIVKALQSFASSFPVAVCGAGQQPAPGVANAEDGITIHLGKLKGVELSSDKSVVSIGAGERWGRVYERLEAEGLSVSGCRASNGGIGGLATHGGMSFFSSARGFIIDDVINYEIVVASGEILNANASEHSDLFKALKGGGGSNFGIITRFEFATFQQGKIWGGKLAYFPQSFPSQLEAIAAYLNSTATDPKAQVRINIGYAAEFGGLVCMNDPTYTEPEKPDVLRPFVDIEPKIEQINTLRVDTVKGMAAEQSAQTQTNQRVLYMTTTLKADAEILKETSEEFQSTLENVKAVPGLVFAATYEPYPISLLQASSDNSLGLDPSAGPLVVLLIYAHWREADDDSKVVSECKTLLEKITETAEAAGQQAPYRYMNYAFPHQDPVSSYGEENKRRLQEVSRKYDVNGFFQKAVRGGFKLF